MEQQRSSFHDAVDTSLAQLEAARCHSAELEGWNSFCASQIQHAAGSTLIETEAMTGSVADAWKALAVAASGNEDSDTKNSKHSSKVRIPSGQHAVAIRKVAVSNSFKRMAVAAQRIEEDKKTSLPSIPREPVGEWMQLLYEKLGNVRKYHAEHQVPPIADDRRGNPVADGYDLAAAIPQWVAALDFTPDEMMGKYVDLLEMYTDFMQNLAILAPTSPYSYIDFLEDISKGLSVWKEEDKLSLRKKYARWLADIEKYLRSFLERTVPLVNVDEITKQGMESFNERWSQTGGFTGWSENPMEAPLANKASTSKPNMDLSKFSSPEDLLAKVDPNAVKTELSLYGLKCGGTPQDRATRLFLLKDKKLENLPAKLFVKKRKGEFSSGEQRVDLARREAVILSLLDQLRPTFEATIRRMERRQTQTLKERETEMETDLNGQPMDNTKVTTEVDSDDEDDAPIYNPKNVPLDWDGKPIPYWLFKLHGLNHYYPCEICGGEAYRGRRAFELHFAEQRHASAMRILGIPNTKHFHGITKVEDAQELWKSLEEQIKEERFDGDNEEEYEDSHGVVLSRKKYEDLSRQGLL